VSLCYTRLMRIDLTSSPTNGRSMADCRALFAQLAPVDIGELQESFQSAFTGPRWLQIVAPRLLVMGGMGGWCGKWFDGQGKGHNWVRRQGDIQGIMPVELKKRPSLIDGQPTCTVIYPHGSRFPWPLIIDELRRLDDQTILGMTIIDIPLLRRVAHPFLLQTTDTIS
jgi:hypothetical protein